MPYVDSAGYVWKRGRVVGRTSPSKAGREVSEGEYIPASGYEEARKINPVEDKRGPYDSRPEEEKETVSRRLFPGLSWRRPQGSVIRG